MRAVVPESVNMNTGASWHGGISSSVESWVLNAQAVAEGAAKPKFAQAHRTPKHAVATVWLKICPIAVPRAPGTTSTERLLGSAEAQDP